MKIYLRRNLIKIMVDDGTIGKSERKRRRRHVEIEEARKGRRSKENGVNIIHFCRIESKLFAPVHNPVCNHPRKRRTHHSFETSARARVQSGTRVCVYNLNSSAWMIVRGFCLSLPNYIDSIRRRNCSSAFSCGYEKRCVWKKLLAFDHNETTRDASGRCNCKHVFFAFAVFVFSSPSGSLTRGRCKTQPICRTHSSLARLSRKNTLAECGECWMRG